MSDDPAPDKRDYFDYTVEECHLQFVFNLSYFDLSNGYTPVNIRVA